MELLPIVDENGNIVGKATRDECHSGSKLLHPVVHLHVFDPEGRLYLQLRLERKRIQPGKWDTAVGGHVDFGETVPEALRRETREELGITEFEPTAAGVYIFESDIEREMVHVFYTVVDKSVPKPSAELAGGKFFTAKEIGIFAEKGKLTPNFIQEYARFAKLFSRVLTTH